MGYRLLQSPQRHQLSRWPGASSTPAAEPGAPSTPATLLLQPDLGLPASGGLRDRSLADGVLETAGPKGQERSFAAPKEPEASPSLELIHRAVSFGA